MLPPLFSCQIEGKKGVFLHFSRRDFWMRSEANKLGSTSSSGSNISESGLCTHRQALGKLKGYRFTESDNKNPFSFLGQPEIKRIQHLVISRITQPGQLFLYNRRRFAPCRA